MKAVVLENKKETKNAKILKLKPDKLMKFKPGQFIMITHSCLKNGKETTIKRAYSITSSPNNKKYLELAFDKKPNGLVSEYLYNLKPKDVLEISKPQGYFVFENNFSEDLVLICGGTGIAPLMSIIRYVLGNKLKNKIMLIYSCKTRQNVIYLNELKEIKKHNKTFDYEIILTRENSNDKRIDINKLRSLIKSTNNKRFYICGPPRMVLDISKMIQFFGVLKDNIKIEGYD
jgi:glycine betaine catabolism B